MQAQWNACVYKYSTFGLDNSPEACHNPKSNSLDSHNWISQNEYMLLSKYNAVCTEMSYCMYIMLAIVVVLKYYSE